MLVNKEKIKGDGRPFSRKKEKTEPQIANCAIILRQKKIHTKD